MERIKNSYNHTIYACYLGYITQAIVNNFAPLLFLTFASDFSLTLDKITLITTINFAVQLFVDLISPKFIEKLGYRTMVIIAHVAAALGLIGLAEFSKFFSNPYVGIMIAVVLYAIGGGIIEVLISPIVEACPTERKEAAMSLLHSFYCWGHVAVVLFSTCFFLIFGIEKWRYVSIIWALVPIFNIFYFCNVPINNIDEQHEKIEPKKLLKNKIFWIIMVAMIAAGASEQAMSQWASTFAEAGLNVSKTIGDIAGPCAFAILMGSSRALYGKFSDRLPLKKAMVLSAVLCIICYILAVFSKSPVFSLIGCALCGFSVGIFWPGTFSIAAADLPGGGTLMYALMALAGDIGCSSGPSVVGFVANANDGNLKTGILVAIVFPVLIFILISLLGRIKEMKE